MKALVAIFCSLALGAMGETWANAHGPRPATMSENERLAVTQCRAATEGAVVLSPLLACFRGYITAETVRPLHAFLTAGEQRLADERQRRLLVINSPGGSITESLDLGRRIDRANLRLIVDGKCFSSCANYIVPAAFVLVVADNSLVTLHGSAPRSPSGHSVMIYNSRGIGPRELTLAISEETFREFPSFHRQYVMSETQYFGDIAQDEYYLHRYFEVKRNIALHAREECQIQGGFHIVVGPDYIEEYLILNIGYFWWPENAGEIFELLASYGMNYTFVLDMDMFPSWTPARGFIDQSTCAADRPPRVYAPARARDDARDRPAR